MNSIKLLVGIIVSTSVLTACGGTPTLPVPAPTSPITTTPATSDPTATPTTGSDYLTRSVNLNPGTSLNPADKGKTLSSDTFKYTLLDAREVESTFMNEPIRVVLVKLEVENISVVNRGLSIVEISLKADDPESPKGQGGFTPDFLYPRSNVGFDLAGDIAVLKPHEKVIGYYLFTHKPYTKLYFNIYSLGTDPVTGESTVLANFLKKAGTFVIKG